MTTITCMLLSLVMFSTTTLAEDGPLVEIPSGLVKGTFQTSTNGLTFAAFEGIPYAQPPILKRRFKEPFPVEPWSGILLANTEYACLQYGMDGKVHGQEDCLYLNVYVPRSKIDQKEKLDVLVHIHGGAFMMGSAVSFSGPKHLMDRNIVYVAMNYRLGPLGFLSAGDDVIAGNFGLKDQSLALRWIKDNIASFGGNPDSVTITGLSAGGASVHLHYFSSMSEGLFHRGFAQSGSALNPWVLQKAPHENLKKLSTLLGCDHEKVRIVLECLRQRPALQIVQAVKEFQVKHKLPLVPFAPVIEFISHSSFITVPPFIQLGTHGTADVPLIISMTTEEGLLPAGFFYNKFDELEEDWETLFPLMLDYYHVADERKAEINRALKTNYLKDEPFTKWNFKNLIKLCSHRLFLVGSVKAARMHAKATSSPVYYLLMGYGGDVTSSRFYTGTDEDFGVGHGMDAVFYYNSFISRKRVSEKEKLMRDMLLDMVVHYAKTGIAKLGDTEWKPVEDAEKINYLIVRGPRNITMKSSKKLAPQNFWLSLGLREDENLYTFKDGWVQIN